LVNKYRLYELLRQRPKKAFQTLAMLLVAGVIMYDGDVDAAEREMFRSVCDAWDVDADALFAIAGGAPVDTIAEVLQAARTHVRPEGWQVMLEMAIHASLVDDRLVFSESLLIRVIADTFSIGPARLAAIYADVTGMDLQDVADLSDPSYYDAFDRRQTGASTTAQDQRSRYAREYDILGLRPDADLAAVKAAYRRMAMELHPDRFQHEPAEESRRRHEEFTRMRNAYTTLLRLYA
jgi:DnaJ-domain-containing protein 1